MARNSPTLDRWHSSPRFAEELRAFLEAPTGQLFLATLRHHFRARPLDLPIQPGVDYLQINALMNRDREAWTHVIDTIEDVLAVPREKKERLPDEGWATHPLRREEDIPEAPKLTSKKKKR